MVRAKNSLAAAKSALGERMVVTIDPRSVDTYCGQRLVRLRPLLSVAVRIAPRSSHQPIGDVLLGIHPFVLRREAFPPVTPYELLPIHVLMQDVVQHRDDFRASPSFARFRRSTQGGQALSYKGRMIHDEASVAQLFAGYLIPLVDSIERYGWSDKVGKDVELGCAAIGSDGRIHKNGQGNHRFSAARSLGVGSFPLRICAIHRDRLGMQERNRRWDWHEIADVIELAEAEHR